MTITAFSRMVGVALQAAEILSKEHGIEAEVRFSFVCSLPFVVVGVTTIYIASLL